MTSGLRGCNVRNMNPEKAEGLSTELPVAPLPLLAPTHLTTAPAT